MLYAPGRSTILASTAAITLESWLPASKGNLKSNLSTLIDVSPHEFHVFLKECHLKIVMKQNLPQIGTFFGD